MPTDALTSAAAPDQGLSSGCHAEGNDRYVTYAADALGGLRRELIENMGWEVARGILARAAYRSGRVDARRLKESSPAQSHEEWLQTAGGFNDLGGRARVRFTRIDINRNAGTFYVAGEWIDSCEASEHLKHFGSGSRPACWTLEGYASGYATELVGRDVLCVETRCRGKGDPVCAFELKPVADWGASGDLFLQMLSSKRFAERFDRCLRSISRMGCALEQSLPDAVITMAADGSITSCNQGGQDLLGILPGEAEGRNVSSMFSGGQDDLARISDQLRREGRMRNYTTALVRADGQKVPVGLAAYAVRDEAGTMVGAVVVAHDLTEIRRLEDELAAKNRFMANILKDSADAIITMDPGNVVTSWNRGAEAIFGYTAAEVVGKHINIIIPPELREAREIERINDRVRAHGVVRSHQTERITKDGKRIQVIFTRTAIRDDTGKFVGSSAVLKDVTKALNLERQLADAEHLATLGELSAGLAHEIKNPLAGIKGAIDVIRDNLPVSDTHRSVLGDVLHEVNRIDQIVRDLLGYAKPKPPSHTDVNLEEMAQRMVAIARQSCKSDSISIVLDVRGTIPGFTGDQTQLEQILLNLLLNARNAVRRQGRITVRLDHDCAEGAIRVEVEDNGCGIPEEIRKKIFQPFFTTRTNGTGLGLATCLKNVQYHGGSIDLRSEPGKGTRFIVTLPLVCRL